VGGRKPLPECLPRDVELRGRSRLGESLSHQIRGFPAQLGTTFVDRRDQAKEGFGIVSFLGLGL
jgi:hypothetical protein